MAFASTSAAGSSALRSMSRNRLGPASRASSLGLPLRPSQTNSAIHRRNFAAAAVAVETPSQPDHPLPTDDIGTSSSSRHSPIPRASRPSISSSKTGGSITPAEAQTFLTDLLHLPPAHQLPPELALQILTHKSYRYAHLVRRPPVSSSPTPRSSRFAIRAQPPPSDSAKEEPSGAPHNARLSFLGRRAIATYLAMFVHSALPTSAALHTVDFLRGRGLEAKLEALRHVNNLGREVGEPWGVGDVMRWDQNPNAAEDGDVRVKGMVVEAVLGGVFTTFGSPAAQRAFHLHILPRLKGQLRDPALIELAESMQEGVQRDFGGVLRR